MLYIPGLLPTFARNYALNLATEKASVVACAAQRGLRVASRQQLIMGVQARLALGEVLAAIADCEASQEITPDVAWLISH